MMEKVKDRTSAAGDVQLARLEALYRLEYSGMVRLAYTLISNSAEAEELVQDAFLDVFRQLDDIREPKAYLRSAVVSRSRSILRRRRTMALRRPERPTDLPPEAGELWDVLAELSEDHRIAVVLRYYCGYRASEISSIIGRPAATVRSHLRRGLAQLRKELST